MAKVRGKRHNWITVHVDGPDGGHRFDVDERLYIGSGAPLAESLLKGGVSEYLDDGMGTVIVWPAHTIKQIVVRPITSDHHATAVSPREQGQ